MLVCVLSVARLTDKDDLRLIRPLCHGSAVPPLPEGEARDVKNAPQLQTACAYSMANT